MVGVEGGTRTRARGYIDLDTLFYAPVNREGSYQGEKQSIPTTSILP